MAIGPSSINKIAGVNPTKVLEAGAHSSLNLYAIQLGSGATISACAGTNPDGTAYNFVTSDNWDAATSDGLLTSGDKTITSVTIVGGVAFGY